MSDDFKFQGPMPPAAAPIGGLHGADAQDSLAKAFERALVQMSQDTLREMAFIALYCPQLMPEVREVINLRFHTSPGILGKIIDAIKAVALHDYHKQAGKTPPMGGK